MKMKEYKTSAKVLITELKRNPTFSTVTAMVGPDVMERYGFEFGDSLDLSFSNGRSFTDVPYHNGYYTDPGNLIVVAYPGKHKLNIAFNLGQASWNAMNLREGDTLTITLHEKGRYLETQNLFSQVHSNDINDYSSEEAFANFRALAGGNLKKGWIYRSASMVNNEHLRAPVVDRLIGKYGIRSVLDLADTYEEIQKAREQEDWASVRFDELDQNGNLITVSLGINTESEKFRKDLSQSILALCELEGPYLINCNEGKDRTGYASALLEALCGASYEEIKADYMKTYENYYGLTEAKTPESFAALSRVYLEPMMQGLFGTSDASLSREEYRQRARQFFQKGGLEETEIDRIERTFSASEK